LSDYDHYQKHVVRKEDIVITLLKVKVFLQKHRIIVIILWIVSIISLIFIFIRHIDFQGYLADPTIIGIGGTLLGAIVGGAFSLLGSVWVNSKQQRTERNIKRKNVIYSPLYDELVNIQEKILEENPFPNEILFVQGIQTIIPRPQFLAWGRIKADTRYLEVPKILRTQMEKLEDTIHEYISVRETASCAAKCICNSVFIENNIKPCTATNLGEYISSDILNNEGKDIYQMVIRSENEQSIDETTRKKVNNEIFERANHNPEIVNTRAKYNNWIRVQKQTIELLSLLITQVLQTYQG